MLALFLLHVLVWMFSWRDLFQVTRTVTLYSAYCAWLVVLLTSPYAILSGAGLSCSMLACRLLRMLVCITRRLYNFDQASIY